MGKLDQSHVVEQCYSRFKRASLKMLGWRIELLDCNAQLHWPPRSSSACRDLKGLTLSDMALLLIRIYDVC